MRTYGRVTNEDGTKSWVKIETDTQGYDDMVWIVTVIQSMLLNLNESPFYADVGIPAKNSVIQQIAPDLYVTLIQQRYAQYFASLVVSRQASVPPTYLVNVTTQQGYKLNTSVPIPT